MGDSGREVGWVLKKGGGLAKNLFSGASETKKKRAVSWSQFLYGKGLAV